MAASDSEAVVRTVIRTSAKAVIQAPFSQAIVAGRMIYTAGCLGFDTAGKLVPGGIKAETAQALKNIGEVLKAAGSDYNQVVKVTILLADINDWPAVNEIYKLYFTDAEHYPARTAYQVAALPFGARVEIEAVAIRGKIVNGKQSNL
jgi:reactive intermediate/imine deaminase